jgi:hypothetical protein
MTDYADIYFVDGRNATVDHRTGQHVAPGRVMVNQPGHVRTVYTQPAQQASPYGQMPMYAPPGYPQGPGYWGPNGWTPTGANALNQGPFGSSLLSRISTGQLIDLIAQVFAALNPLPAQPVATSDATTDVGNLILYQGSLASYAKKDEQVRTLGHLIAKLVG